MMHPEIERMLLENGYEHFRMLQGRAIGICKFAFTWGVVFGIDEVGYERRYCFQHRADAQAAYDAIGDYDDHLIGPWIKCKGVYKNQPIDLLNPEWSTK